MDSSGRKASAPNAADEGVRVGQLAAPNKPFFVSQGAETVGPLSFGELKERVLAGALGNNDLVCQEGWKNWLPLHEVLGASAAVLSGDAEAQRPTLTKRFVQAYPIVRHRAAIAALFSALTLATVWGVLSFRSVTPKEGTAVNVGGAVRSQPVNAEKDIPQSPAQQNAASTSFGKKGTNDYFATEVEQLLPRAAAGDTQAALELAQIYGNDLYAKRDYREALKWGLLAAEKGSSEAQLLVGGMYAAGEGTVKNPGLAVLWFVKAADQGNELARSLIILHYSSRDWTTMKQDERINAYKWALLDKSPPATLDLFGSQMTLAEKLTASRLAAAFRPTGAEAEQRVAAQAKRAADERLAAEQAKGARERQQAEEVESRLVGYLRRRSAAGSDNAQLELGLRHLSGEGVEPNLSEGIRLLNAAQAGGNNDASTAIEIEKRYRTTAGTQTSTGFVQGEDPFMPSLDSRPTAQFESKRFLMGRAAASVAFPVAFSSFVQSGQELFGTNVTTGWGPDGFDPLMPKPKRRTYLLSAFARSASKEDFMLNRTCLGIWTGRENSSLLIQVEIPSGVSVNPDTPVRNTQMRSEFERSVRACLTTLAEPRFQECLTWITASIQGGQLPNYSKSVPTTDRKRSTDGSLKLFVKDFERVKLMVRLFDETVLPDTALRQDAQISGRSFQVCVFVVPKQGRIYVRDGAWGLRLNSLPPELVMHLGNVLDL
jgi:TPR repeat protein